MPTHVLTGITHHMIESGDQRLLYRMAKESIKPFIEEVMATHDVQGEDAIAIMQKLSTTAGWGEVEIETFHEATGQGAFVIKESPIPELYGSSERCVDHLTRGLITGTLEVVCDRRDLLGIESQCMAKGDRVCRVLVKPRSAFDPEKLRAFDAQIPNSE